MDKVIIRPAHGSQWLVFRGKQRMRHLIAPPPKEWHGAPFGVRFFRDDEPSIFAVDFYHVVSAGVVDE